jgi:hypothetical protein
MMDSGHHFDRWTIRESCLGEISLTVIGFGGYALYSPCEANHGTMGRYILGIITAVSPPQFCSCVPHGRRRFYPFSKMKLRR